MVNLLILFFGIDNGNNNSLYMVIKLEANNNNVT